MRARNLFFGPEKPRALWRVLMFLGLGIPAFVALGIVAAPLVPGDTEGYWAIILPSLVTLAATLVASFAMMRMVERRSLAALGLPLDRELLTGWLKGAVIGGGFMALLVAVLAAMGWLRLTADTGTPLQWLSFVTELGLVLAVAAAAEEVLFRGYPFQVLVEGLGAPLAVFISSTLFALLHIYNPEIGPLALLNIGLAGVLMAAVYLRTRSLWTATGLHWAWNWVMAAVFDLPVSGIDFDVPGYDPVQQGPDLLTGGSFGPEAGLLTTIMVVPLIGWTLHTRRLSASRRITELRPLVDVGKET